MESKANVFGRHLKGWQSGAVIVGMALVTAAVVVPRPVVPGAVPSPHVDRRAQKREWRAFHERAKAALEQPLPFEVRAVGEALRGYGAAEEQGEAPRMATWRAQIRQLASRALAEHGAGRLRELRALQTALFVNELARWEKTHEATLDLRQLGGGFIQRARKNGWVVDGRIVADRYERATLFGFRWTRLAALDEHAEFAPTLVGWQTYLRFLIDHPEVGRDGRSRPELQLSYIAGVERRDPGYPAALARGVVLYQARSYALAANAFEDHLANRRDGPHQLRARNYLAQTRRMAAATH